MNLSLNIYKGREVEKTYTTDTYDLEFGTLEDLISAVDVDKLDALSGSGNELELGKLILSLLPQIKPILKSIFYGITDEEIRRTHVKELIPVFVQAFKFAFSEINGLNADGSGN